MLQSLLILSSDFAIGEVRNILERQTGVQLN